MLMLDRIVELEPRRSARAHKCVSYSEPWFQGQPSDSLMLPPVLCLEAISQLMCVLACASDAMTPEHQIFVLAGAEKVKFRHSVVPGDQMAVSVTVIEQRANIWKCQGRVYVQDTLCVEAVLLAAVQGRNGD